MKKLVLIDGNSLINRAFYALPLLSNSDGEFSNAVYGFCRILIKIIETEKPDYIAVAFDKKAPTFRHKMYDGYKSGRKGMPDELASQMPILKKMLTAMNVKYFEQDGIEADDILGMLSKNSNCSNIIVSGDRDVLQLIDNNTRVYLTKKGITDIVNLDAQTCKDYLGVYPNQVVELKALMGDSSDSIPGVKGVGEKTALDLISRFENIENLYAHIDEISGKLKEKLIENKNMAFLSKELATIRTDNQYNFRVEECVYDFPFNNEVEKLFNYYDFKTLLKKREYFKEQESVAANKKISKKVVNSNDIGDLVEKIKQTKQIGFFVQENSLNVSLSKFEENIIKFDENLNEEEVLNWFKPIFEDESIEKFCFDGKFLKHKLYELGISLHGIAFDIMIADYLISGSKKSDITTEKLCFKYGYDTDCVASCIFCASFDMLEKLKDENMTDLFFKMELPLIEVLFQMENNGFKIDKEELIKLNKVYNQELLDLSNQIQFLAGEEFNVNSPKQLAEVLFDKMKLNIQSNKKKSTNVEILEKIEHKHPIISLILRYRKIAKLNSTYVEAFLNLLDENNFIHTSFIQTLTATGRLSSKEPNLQNIPIRDDEGKKLRKIFIPRHENGVIITADYSQIELRLMAHYSKDENLIEAYRNNKDIHNETASKIFNVKNEEVTPLMRRHAKAVNFGIIYGISDFGLSNTLNVDRKLAKEFIDKYFETFKGVKEFLLTSVESAKQNGFVLTLMGRKRKIDELSSSNYQVRQFGERAAMNMPLQGSGSDIIKMAMVNVYKKFSSMNLKSKLILTIHDELIVDSVKEELEIVKQVLKEEMENVITLSVPLVVDISVGENWYEAK